MRWFKRAVVVGDAGGYEILPYTDARVWREGGVRP